MPVSDGGPGTQASVRDGGPGIQAPVEAPPRLRRSTELLAAAACTPGFFPEEEALALHAAACRALEEAAGPLVEVGAYLGRSTLYLAAACAAAPAERAAVCFSVDHHRGSEEMQAGWPHHDPGLVDPLSGRMDTLGRWRLAIERAGAEDLVVAVVGESPTVSANWSTPCAMVLLDGGHGEAIARADFRSWSRHLSLGGLLAIHDVFPDPADGGRPPYECYLEALASGHFAEETGLGRGSLRVLRRVAPDPGHTPRPGSRPGQPVRGPQDASGQPKVTAAGPPRSASSASSTAAAE